MGENKHIKELDAFAKKYIKEIQQEKVSIDFTNSLMNKINAESKISIYETKSLISKKAWTSIFLIVIATIVFSFDNSKDSLWNIPRIDFSFLDNLQLSNLISTLSISNTIFYSVILFGFMFLLQIVYLKKYFEKRLN